MSTKLDLQNLIADLVVAITELPDEPAIPKCEHDWRLCYDQSLFEDPEDPSAHGFYCYLCGLTTTKFIHSSGLRVHCKDADDYLNLPKQG